MTLRVDTGEASKAEWSVAHQPDRGGDGATESSGPLTTGPYLSAAFIFSLRFQDPESPW